MKQGYIVINLTTSDVGYEVFGVYRTLEKAERELARVMKARFGKMSDDEIDDYCVQEGESFQIIAFTDWGGHTYNIND